MDEEYIATLSENERMVFVKLFCVLIASDGIIDQDEISFLKQITQKYNIQESIVVQIIKNVKSINYLQEASKITNRGHALELIKELCFLANADDNLDEKELSIIVNIARTIGIEDEKLVLINRFVLENMILYRVGRTILEKENG